MLYDVFPILSIAEKAEAATVPPGKPGPRPACPPPLCTAGSARRSLVIAVLVIAAATLYGLWNLPEQMPAEARDTSPDVVGGTGLALPTTKGGSIEQKIQGHYLYMDFSSDVATHQFRIIDISDVTRPEVVGGEGLSLPLFSRALDVVEKWAYIGTDLNAFRILNISDASNPVIVGGNELVFSNAIRSLKVVGPYAYLGIYESNGIKDRGLIILDISNPSRPRQISPPIISGLVSEVRSLDVVGNHAYLLSYWDDDAPGRISSNVLRIVDVSDPLHPVVVGGETLVLPNYGRQIKVVGNYAYAVFDAFGTASGIDNGLSPDQYFRVIDISDPSKPVVVGGDTLPFASSSDSGGLKSLFVAGNFAYVTESQSNRLFIIDVADPVHPAMVGSQDVGTGTGIWSVVVSGGYAFVGCNGITGTDVLRILKLGTPIIKAVSQ